MPKSEPLVRWYVTTYDDKPTRRELTKETEHFFCFVDRIGRPQREKKFSNWYSFHETEAEALAAIAARKQRVADAQAAARARDAAQDLLEALQLLFHLPSDCGCEVSEATLQAYEKAHAAIQKATGGEA